MAELALALSRSADVVSWVPTMSRYGLVQSWTRSEASEESGRHRKVHFPLQRGYSRFSFEPVAGAFRKVHTLLARETPNPERTALICTSSFWETVAQSWRGPVIYYATDMTVAYSGLSSARVRLADRAICRIADLVCPNSARLAAYLTEECGCPEERVVVLPNATRAANIRQCSCDTPDTLPADVPHLGRPIAGVIGNLAGNLDWELLERAIEQTPLYTWLFVGPSSMRIADQKQRRARARVMRATGRCFIGARPYRELFRYARAVDVSVMPYRNLEPTYSGSATRFYEHLAAGRPILSTRGVEELLHKEPLLHLVDDATEMAQQLERLRVVRRDGLEEARRLASRSETWEARASRMVEALSRMPRLDR